MVSPGPLRLMVLAMGSGRTCRCLPNLLLQLAMSPSLAPISNVPLPCPQLATSPSLAPRAE